ncbi:MAG: DUF2157 domain-containing protein [Lactobacillales bacterium]|jgi:uncharacterized membrane protein|nr:DUF2157 domain-containing protein [Lactobacillales bacterium]
MSAKTTPPRPVQHLKKKVTFFEWGLLFLGVFCVVAGLGLIIASNWDAIPAFVKLAGSLALFACGLYATYVFHQRQKPLGMEISLFFSYLMIGANIALVQQIYHLQISFAEGALFWSIMAIPLLLVTKRPVLPIVWVIMFTFGAFDYIRDLLDFIGYKGVASLFFLIFLLSYMGESRRASIIRGGSIILMLGTMLVGDSGARGDISSVGAFITIITAGLLLHAAAEKKPVRFFNIVLIYVAIRIIMLFWTAYGSLFNMGVSLVVFGGLILAICALYYYKRDKLIELWHKGFDQ